MKHSSPEDFLIEELTKKFDKKFDSINLRLSEIENTLEEILSKLDGKR